MFVEASHRFRFYPTSEQANLLNRTFGCVRVVYNRARALRETAWKEHKQSIGFFQTSKLLTQWKKDPEFVWLNEVPSVPLQQALRHLDSAYKNFFRKTARYPRFRKKHERQSAEFTKAGFYYKNGVLKLAKMAEPLKVVWSRDLPSEPSSVIVVREPDNRWYVSCRVLLPVSKIEGGEEAVGIDLGSTEFAAITNGEHIENPRHLKKRQKKIARLQRRAAKKQKGSRNRNKARIKAAREMAKVRHCRSDFLHKLSTRLVRENKTVCLETLSIKGMLRAKRCSGAIADAAWGEFSRMISYKCRWYGRTLVKIDRWYPSTKTCSECGTTGHILSLSNREWTCPDCGAHHHRDMNAAHNIRSAGLAVLNACGGDVSPKVPRHRRLFPVKQEPKS